MLLLWLAACGAAERAGDADAKDGAENGAENAPPGPGAEDASPSATEPGPAADGETPSVTPSSSGGPSAGEPTLTPSSAVPEAPSPEPGCSASAPPRPTILSPESNARDMRRDDLLLAAAPLADADGHALLATEFEIRAYTGENDPPLVWSGQSATPEIRLSEGLFADASATTLQFEQSYSLTARFRDTGDCNNVSEWSLPVLFATADGSDELFDPSVVRTLELFIPTDNGSPSSWESIDAEAGADDCEPMRRNYYEGSVAFEGQQYEGVGIRTKGGCGSSRTLDEKPSFKVKLDWDPDPTDDVCPEDRALFGRSTLTLNAGVQDRTAMHEHLTYRYYRESGVPAPRTAAIQVFVNGSYYGLYQNVESYDRRLLARFFDESQGKGMMYEGAYWCDFFSGDDASYADGHCWDREFSLDACDGTPDPGDDLQFFEADGSTTQDPWRFLAELHTGLEAITDPELYYPAVRDRLDWDAFLAYWATSAVVIDWDNYVYNQNNFRLYHHPATGRWHFFPWGVDQTWVVRAARRNVEFAALTVRGDVARLCLDALGTTDDGTCTERFVERLGAALEAFETTDWNAAIAEWQERLDPFMQLEEDRKSYDYDEWLEALDELRDFAATRPAALRAELADAGF